MRSDTDGRSGFCRACNAPTRHPGFTHAEFQARSTRATDRQTSHAAAASIDTTEVQRRVLSLLLQYGPMTDEEILARYQSVHGPCAESSPRKRRCDLVALGMVKDTGQTRLLKTGRMGTVWASLLA